MTIFKSQKITELESRVDELETENLDLKGKLEVAAQTAETDQAAALVTATETIATLTEANAEIPSLNATIVEHVAKITELETANVVTNEKIDAAAATKLASLNHAEPLDLGKTTPIETKKDLSALTGHAKAAAFFKK